jgi:hypothetical protein
MIERRRLKLVGHVARMEKRNVYWWENQKERDHYEEQDVSEWIVF